MDRSNFHRQAPGIWRAEPSGAMRVPAIIYADDALMLAMDDKVFDQVTNVAMLPGIVGAAYAMPDAHWGYGFPIGGVAAFDPEQDGVISAGGVGFDISCGVRAVLTHLSVERIQRGKEQIAERLYQSIPAGLGSKGHVHLDPAEMDRMLAGGARWAVSEGYGDAADLARIEESGCMPGADPAAVSEHAKQRQQDEIGTLGSGNHYLEVQEVAEIFDEDAAAAFGLRRGEAIVSIHCGSRGLGHQIGTDFLHEMVTAAAGFGIELPDRELACCPIRSELGQRYLGAMRAGTNCALANRQILTHLTRGAFAHVFGRVEMPLLFDVSHNTCKEETHLVAGKPQRLFVHRKGATRAFGPGNPTLPPVFSAVGQPVLIGGSMGTSSYVLAGTRKSEELAFSSACHGAGRRMSRHAAMRQWRGRAVVDALADRGIIVRSPSLRGVAEEAPLAYKNSSEVVDSADRLGLARKVARLEPMVCIKG
ncbi:RtcB family protein [Dongia sedimenti]|uniref:tRNA-splicing ligase RtcB n=1 Tax=Dongia sedimenti TaxID=3064282 RepID=A0ABU0YUH6_9PROT|nr:RtcB family protein [Rhodospirillaceae bacterium R-7]